MSVFQYGIASGDPLPDRVVLWTRVGGELPVSWEIASDREFNNIIQSGIETARAEHDFTIHVDPAPLEPAGRVLAPRHRAGADQESKIGGGVGGEVRRAACGSSEIAAHLIVVVVEPDSMPRKSDIITPPWCCFFME